MFKNELKNGTNKNIAKVGINAIQKQRPKFYAASFFEHGLIWLSPSWTYKSKQATPMHAASPEGIIWENCGIHSVQNNYKKCHFVKLH